MDEAELLRSEIMQLSIIVSDLEAKVNDMYARPLMPYSSGATSGDILTLGSDLRPYWNTP